MDKARNVRLGWLKFMYLYTIVGAGCMGVGMIANPEAMRSAFGWPNSDQITAAGVTGSVFIAFALLSILGFRSPLKFAPVLLLQLTYKVIWLAGVILPLLSRGEFPTYAILPTIVFGSYIIGDLIAIPFPLLFSRPAAVEIQM